MEATTHFCLICGQSLLNTDLDVKVEPPADLEDEVDSRNDNLEGLTTSNKWSSEETLSFQWFLRWMTGSSGTSKKYDGSFNRFPFCGNCKKELMRLVELQQQLEEIQRRIQVGVEGIRSRIEETEEPIFGGDEGIYKKDGRYKKIRQMILRKRRKNGTASRVAGLRRKEEDPVVLISQVAKEYADKHLASQVTSEETPESCEVLTQTIKQEAIDDGGDISHDIRSKKTGGRSRKRKNIEVDPENDDVNDSFGGDFDFSPSPPEEVPPSKKPRRKQSCRKKPVDKDKDWTLEETPEQNEVEPDLSSEEDSSGKRKYYHAKVDPEKGTLSYKNLLFHQIPSSSSTSNSSTYQCSECSAEVQNKGGRIRSHYLKWHSNQYACSLCNFRGYGNFSLKEHIASIHQGQKKLKPLEPCPVCWKPVAIHKLKGHLWSHKSQEERQEALESQPDMVPHGVKRRHQCDQCGATFRTPGDLLKHRENKHLSPEEDHGNKLLCPECGGTFKNLQRHLQRSHSQSINEGGHRCHEDPNCGKVFKSAGELNKHKNSVHRKIRNFKCPLCPRAFFSSWNLKNHQNNHLGIRPWKCQDCPSSFTGKHSLVRHRGIYHSGGGDGGDNGGDDGRKPRRKAYVRGPTLLSADKKKRELQKEGKYLPPSALATWAAGREPTSHFLSG